MKKLLTLAAAATAATLMAAPANAVLIDFVAEAAVSERGVTNGTSFASANFGGLSLTFNASGNAYFDGIAGGKPGGLGDCQTLRPDMTCSPNSDDNVGATMEWVRIEFDDGPFTVANVSFNGTIGGVQHLSLDNYAGGMVLVTTNLAAVTAYTFAAAAATNFGAVSWIRFDYMDTEFYVSSISDIPIPAALPLLLSGLAGLGFASRRRKSA